MKKVLLVISILLLSVGLTACRGTSKESINTSGEINKDIEVTSSKSEMIVVDKNSVILNNVKLSYVGDSIVEFNYLEDENTIVLKEVVDDKENIVNFSVIEKGIDVDTFNSSFETSYKHTDLSGNVYYTASHIKDDFQYVLYPDSEIYITINWKGDESILNRITYSLLDNDKVNE